MLSAVHKSSSTPVRAFCKTEWTKPKFVNKPYCEHRRQLPSVQKTKGHSKAQYADFWKSWRDLQYELLKPSLACRSKLPSMLASVGLCDHKKVGSDSAISCFDVNKNEKKRQVDAIIQTYSELQLVSTPQAKKRQNATEENLAKTSYDGKTLGEAKLNATTASADESENLAQKIEAIEEVPLVEAEPDIKKPPKTTGPTVMNMTPKYDSEMLEENSTHSEFQVYDEAVYKNSTIYYQRERNLLESLSQSNINDYFESGKSYSKKPVSGLTLNHLLSEITDDSLSGLLERIRERNRARSSDHRLYTTKADDSRFSHQNQPMPQWVNWPQNPYTPQHNRPSFPSQPMMPRPRPNKAEPLTPDNRPHTYRMQVSAVNLTLHLGPLVSAFKHATALFPLLPLNLDTALDHSDA